MRKAILVRCVINFEESQRTSAIPASAPTRRGFGAHFLPAGRQAFAQAPPNVGDGLPHTPLCTIEDLLHSALVFVLYLSCLLLVTSCATIERTPAAKPQGSVGRLQVKAASAGSYHKVEKGQTLWRIAKMYGIELDEILASNKITDSTRINVGQSLFIPKVQRTIAAKYSNPYTMKDFIWPIRGKVVSGFGDKANNITNKGITLRTYADSAVIAANTGTVVFTNEKLKGYGKTIIIAHDGGLMTVYTRLSRILVKPGEHISQGMPIARCDNGLMHFEIRKGHAPQNPYYYLPG